MTLASASRPMPPILRPVIGLIAAVSVLAPLLVVLNAPRVAPYARVKVAERVVPRTELPPVEPVAFQDLSPQDAVAFNAAIPLVGGANPAARPFHIAGPDIARARAVDCLATAVLYEAGDDTTGERAVAQVILNRVRHPAFPKTVCGVVFEGSERATGCQFTFTCDGALGRWHPTAAAWGRAREVAIAALTGSVDRLVGYATHYHTNWVVPYWSSSLDKIAAVGTHLFFRWTGWWGTPPAFNRTVSSDEPVIAALGAFSEAHRVGLADMAEVNPVEVAAATTGTGGILPLSGNGDSFLVTLDPHMGADAFPAVALKTCGTRDYCKVMAWTDRNRTPSALPIDQGQISAMAFSYLRDRARGYEKALWNCAQFQRTSRDQCMKLQVLATPVLGIGATPPTAAPRPSPTAPASFTLKPVGPDGLTGVRRKVEASGDAPARPQTEAQTRTETQAETQAP